jgi:hypothetical protein
LFILVCHLDYEAQDHRQGARHSAQGHQAVSPAVLPEEALDPEPRAGSARHKSDDRLQVGKAPRAYALDRQAV